MLKFGGKFICLTLAEAHVLGTKLSSLVYENYFYILLLLLSFCFCYSCYANAMALDMGQVVNGQSFTILVFANSHIFHVCSLPLYTLSLLNSSLFRFTIL